MTNEQLKTVCDYANSIQQYLEIHGSQIDTEFTILVSIEPGMSDENTDINDIYFFIKVSHIDENKINEFVADSFIDNFNQFIIGLKLVVSSKLSNYCSEYQYLSKIDKTLYQWTATVGISE